MLHWNSGIKRCKRMARTLARQLHMPVEHVLVGSTGRIGVPLPMQNVNSGILATISELGKTAAHGSHFAEAIMTSDRGQRKLPSNFCGKHEVRNRVGFARRRNDSARHESLRTPARKPFRSTQPCSRL